MNDYPLRDPLESIRQLATELNAMGLSEEAIIARLERRKPRALAAIAPPDPKDVPGEWLGMEGPY
jgi:hypothetical protein